ncbi:MAG TPA: hypothetical protein VFP65_18990 [Anaeromyxobacteraceae bacterium]|nr:hypothetical protein [Anaeromyxobacteraceae bacterium]
MNRAAVLAAALALAGCGTWSNEDIAFVEALPTSQALRLALPAQGAQPLCAGLGESQVWLGARRTGDGLNAGVDAMIVLVDAVKSVLPTERHEDRRVWGPFDDGKHPGREIRVTMTRDRAGDLPIYHYAFEARPRGGAFQSVIDGSFTGASARSGHGQFTLRFPVLRALGMNDSATDPTGDVAVTYDRTGDPRTIALQLSQDGFGVTAFDYGYVAFAAGQGQFSFALTDAQSRTLLIDADFTATGSGHARVTVLGPNGGRLAYDQCWDDASCITNVRDPFGISGLCQGATCPAGACPPP